MTLHTMRFEVLSVVTMQIGVLWDVKCNLVDVCRSFGGMCFLYPQGKSLNGDRYWQDPMDSIY
jgi:hypothetical protein